MTLRKSGYLPRIIDKRIEETLEIFGAVSVEGPKWCGKTWSSLNHANSVYYILDPAGGYSNRERARINPALALEGSKPHLIDEWQEVPGIWDAVRFDVDQETGAGKYILTGSVTPRREAYIHSGTGRFAVIRMRPMRLFESGDSTGAVSYGFITREHCSRAVRGIMSAFQRGGRYARRLLSQQGTRHLQRWGTSLPRYIIIMIVSANSFFRK
jgi:predicted AAA+ superfamily ATPase